MVLGGTGPPYFPEDSLQMTEARAQTWVDIERAASPLEGDVVKKIHWAPGDQRAVTKEHGKWREKHSATYRGYCTQYLAEILHQLSLSWRLFAYTYRGTQAGSVHGQGKPINKIRHD